MSCCFLSSFFFFGGGIETGEFSVWEEGNGGKRRW